MKFAIFIFVSSCLSLAFAGSTWDHSNQAAWVNNQTYCGGMRQSPINLRRYFSATVNKMKCLKWENYHKNADAMQINVNTHSVDSIQDRTRDKSSSPKISGGPLNGTYVFDQLHFHWGVDNSDGSEHAIDSKKYQLELHFVHFNSKFTNISEAVLSGEPEALAVVGILFKVGLVPDVGVEYVLKELRRCRDNGYTCKQFALPMYLFRLGFTKNYYTYQGSLTTPACYEVVRWIVFNEVRSINNFQLMAFRGIKKDGVGMAYVENFRELQDTNDREVQFVAGNDCSWWPFG